LLLLVMGNMSNTVVRKPSQFFGYLFKVWADQGEKSQRGVCELCKLGLRRGGRNWSDQLLSPSKIRTKHLRHLWLTDDPIFGLGVAEVIVIHYNAAIELLSPEVEGLG
jgi:hypothetical protein